MKKPVSIKLDIEILEKCKEIAKDNKKTFTQLITDILFDYIKNYKRRDYYGI
jgi:predicted transcriptional regulator